MNTYDIGDVANLTGRFYSDAALTTPADPSTVTLTIEQPNGALLTPAPTHASTGVWTYAYVPSQAGLHEIRWVGTGAMLAASQAAIYVRQALDIGANLCTLEEVKLHVGTQDDSQDAIAGLVIMAVSKAFATRYQREFAPVAGGADVTRRVAVRDRRVDLNPFDLVSVTSMTLDPDDQAVALTAGPGGYQLRPVPSLTGTFYVVQLSTRVTILTQTAIEFGQTELEIVGKWGMATPVDVNRAAIVTAASWLDKAVTAYALDSDGLPSSVRPEFAGTWAIPDAAHRVMQPYRRFAA